MNSSQRIQPNTWVDKYADEFLRYTLIRVSDRAEAEDLVQDTFLAAIKGLKNFREDSSEKTWLYQILKNKIVDFYRKTKSKTVNSSSLEGSEERSDIEESSFFVDKGAFAGKWNDDNLPGKYGDLLNDPIEKKQFNELLLLCIDRMPATYQEIFKMKFLLDLPGKEICKETGVTSSNLWIIIHRSKLQLRSCLEKIWLNK